LISVILFANWKRSLKIVLYIYLLHFVMCMYTMWHMPQEFSVAAQF